MSSEALSRWRSFRWQLIEETVEQPAMHVALDEALLQSVINGQRGPTLRFWAWASPAVIIGRFQSLRNEVDETVAADLGIQVVRRMSGGGAMYVRPGDAITYSLYMPDSLLEGLSIRDSYAFCDHWIVDALRSLGADVSYAPINDIVSPLGKVGGAAQARRPGGILHHTTIAYRMDGGEMARILRIGREKLSDKGTVSAAKRVHPLFAQLNHSREQIVARCDAAFRSAFGWESSDISRGETAAAMELVRTRYGTMAWTRELP